MAITEADSTAPREDSTSSSNQQELNTPSNQAPKSSVCVPCRNKHLKCDGLQTCSRCSAEGLNCVYLKSRRGFRGRGAHDKEVSSMNEATSDLDITISNLRETNSSNTGLNPPIPEVVLSPSLDFPAVTKDSDSNGIYSLLKPSYQQRCMEAFFHHFYDAHPFMPPAHQLLHFFKTDSMNHLQTAIYYVGSRYVSGSPTESFKLEFEPYLLPTSASPKDASMVQAMLLFALGLDGNNEQQRAIEILRKAQSLAVELGMNHREYAVANGRGSPICEESLRRTWWELYVVSVMVAGFHGRGTFHLRDTISTVPLPCEEKEFISGCISQFHTIEQFDDNSFENEYISWSSYAYRISAARNLDRILQADQIIFLDEPTLYRQEAHLTNWHLHLPDNKKVFFDQSGGFDEMIFQAHMIANMSSLLLYRSFSHLDSLAVKSITPCTEQPPLALGLTPNNTHTIRITQAAFNISKLITLPAPLIKHTHFFVCALTLSSITHLSLWSSLPVIAPDQDLKQQIRMNLGALKAVAPVCPAAGIGFRQVTSVMQKIYAYRKDAFGEVFWRDFIEGDFMSGLVENAAGVDN